MSTMIREKIIAWLKIARLQFYLMALVAYSMGAAAAFVTIHSIDLRVYWLGYILLFLIELCTVLVNEYNDYDTDRLNTNYSIFTGGTRIIVEGKLTFREVRIGIYSVLALIGIFTSLLLHVDQSASPLIILAYLLAGLFLGLGYTLPPLEFSYRGAGETVVGVTHSFYVTLCGYFFQSGNWHDPLPWLLSIPLFFATLAAILLAGIPDRAADSAVGKRTIAVIFGPRRVAQLAAGFVILAAISAIALRYCGILRGAPGLAVFVVIPHAAALVLALFRLMKSGVYDRRIDPIMGSALSYIIWFGMIPLVSLLWGGGFR
jgi:1,4-dihydroxy-2-naphthoate octaprenyltransferase